MTRGKIGETYVAGGLSERTNLFIVESICDLVDEMLGRPQGHARELMTFVADRPGHDFRYAIDCSYIKSELGWSPAHDLTSGLRSTVAWYLENQDWVDRVVDQSYLDYYARRYQS